MFLPFLKENSSHNFSLVACHRKTLPSRVDLSMEETPYREGISTSPEDSLSTSVKDDGIRLEAQIEGDYSRNTQSVEDIEGKLLKCIHEGDEKEFREILKIKRIHLNQPMTDGRLLLNVAVADGQLEIVQLLLCLGASVMASDRDGNLALFYAIKRNRKEIAKLLLQTNAHQQLHARNHKDENLYEWITKAPTISHSWLELIQEIGKRSESIDLNEAQVPKKSSESTNAADCLLGEKAAASLQRSEDTAGSMTEILSIADERMQPQTIDEIQENLLECICNGDGHKFETIIKRTQIDLNEPMIDGRFFLHFAVLKGQKDIVEVSLKHGASTLAMDRDGKFALHFAIEENQKEIGSLLLQRNVNEQLHTSCHGDESLYDCITKDPAKRHWLDLVPQKANRPGFVGNLYQLNILALLSLRSYKDERFMEFKLAMEVGEFGKFDDIVFECGSLKLLMQIKHKCLREKSEIGKEELLSNKMKKVPPFSLRKYYESYCELVRGGRRDIEKLILLTNITLKDDSKKYFEEDPLGENHILNVDPDTIKRYKLLENEVMKESSMRGIDEEIFRTFCQKFRLILNFPDEEHTRKFIQKQISKLFNLQNSEIVDYTFLQKIQNWFKEQVSKPITNSMISNFYEMIHENLIVMQGIGLHKSNCDALPKVNFVSHNEEVQNFIENLDDGVLLIHSTCVQLTVKRIIDCLHSKYTKEDDFMLILSRNVIPQGSNASKFIANAIKSKNSFKIFIFSCEKAIDLDELFSQFQRNLKDSKKKVLLVIDDDGFPHNLQNFRNTHDNPLFRHLSDESRDMFMKQWISFQGRNVTLDDIMSKQLVDEVFEPQTLYESIVSQSQIKIQSHWSFDSSSIAYIHRKIQELDTQSICDEKDFYATRLHKATVVICGDPGAGKSLLLANVQKNMNASNNRIWSIKLNLNDFAHVARNANHFSRIDFTESETEKSIEFLCKMIITPHTGQLSFSQKLTQKLLSVCLRHKPRSNEILPKVVLLFDGFDEIAPKYSEKVLCLFRALNRTNIEQMWISTRNHEAKVITQGLNLDNYEAKVKLSEDQIIQMNQILNKNQIPSSLVFLEKADPLMFHAEHENAFDAFHISKIQLDDIQIIEDFVVKILSRHSDENIKLTVEIEKASDKPSLKLATKLHNQLPNADWLHIIDLLKSIFSKESVLNFVTINLLTQSNLQYQSKKPSIQLLEVKFNDFIIQVWIDRDDHQLRIIINDKLKVFSLLNPDKSQQSEFLLKFFESHQDKMASAKKDAKVRNILSLFKIIGHKYDEYKQRLLATLGIAEETFSVNISTEIERSLKTFLDIPLHLQMLSELAVNSHFEFTADLRLHRVYKELIALKEEIYLDDKQRQGSNADESRAASIEKACSLHRIMARALLLGERSEETEESEENLFKDQQMLSKLGLTTYRAGRLEFVHRTFGEYFLALEIWKTIRKPETQELLLKTILVDESFALVRQFLDSILSEYSGFEGLTIQVPEIAYELKKVKWNLEYLVDGVCTEGNFNILRLLLKTLENGKGSCYPLFGSEFHKNIFIETFVAKAPSEAIKIFSDTSSFNPQTLNCMIELLHREWEQLSFHIKRTFIEDIQPTYIDCRKMLLRKDSSGNSVLQNSACNEEEYEYFLNKLKAEFNSETYKDLLLHTNLEGVTFLSKGYFLENLFSSQKLLQLLLPSKLLQQLIETCDLEGDSILNRLRSGALFIESFESLCNLTKFSEDFLIIMIFDNYFLSTKSLHSILQKFEGFFSKCNQSSQLNQQRQAIREVIQRNQSCFEMNLAKFNEALHRQSLKEIEMILSDSKECIRELVLASECKQETILRNADIILKIAQHLESYTVVYQHWILRLPLKLIEFNCEVTLERIFLKVLEILITLKASSCYCFLIKYICLAIGANQRKILVIVLNFLKNSQKSAINDLLLYENHLLLRYIDDEFDNSHSQTKDFLFTWFYNNVSDFEGIQVLKVFMIRSALRFPFFIDESARQEKILKLLNEIDSLTRNEMIKIFFEASFCGFNRILENLRDWINQKPELPFRLVDVIHIDPKPFAFLIRLSLCNILDSIIKFKLKPEFLHLLNLDDPFSESLQTIELSESCDMEDMAKYISIIIKVFGWEFVFFNYKYLITFLNEYTNTEYVMDILKLVKQHQIKDLEIKNFTFAHLFRAAYIQPNFVEIIEFCVDNFRYEFEDFLSKPDYNGNSMFDYLKINSECYKILHYFDTGCGEKYKEILFDFMRKTLSSDSRNTTLCGFHGILEFVLDKYLESNTLYAPLFYNFEYKSLEYLHFASNCMCEVEWKSLFRESSNNNFEDLIKKVLQNGLLEGSFKSHNGNLLHFAFKLGIALRTLEIIPKRHLKPLLCQLDEFSRNPFHYLRIEENLEDLIGFLLENIEVTDRDEILEALKANKEGNFVEQVKIGIEKIREN